MSNHHETSPQQEGTHGTDIHHHERRRESTDQPHYDKTQEDIDLEDAIGNVFDDFDFGEIRHMQPEQQQQQQPNEDHSHMGLSHEQEMHDSIENALDDVFSGKHTESNTDEGNLHEEQKEQTASEDHDHMDLDDAIGNAFNDIFGTTETHNDVQQQESTEITKETEHSEVHTSDLHNAIADTLDNLSSKQDIHEQQPEIQSQPQTKRNELEHNDEMNLDDVIGDAFSHVFNKEQETKPESETTTQPASGNVSESITHPDPKETKEQQQVQKSESTTQKESELSVADAIGDVFNNFFKDHDKPKEHEHEDHKQDEKTQDDDDLNAAIGDAFGNVLRDKNESESSKEVDVPDDKDDLEDAIGDAFNNIFNKNNQSEPVPEQNESHSVESKVESEVTQSEQLKVVESPDQKEPPTAEPEEDNLEDAIGDAFANIFANNLQENIEAEKPKEKENEQPQEQQQVATTPTSHAPPARTQEANKLPVSATKNGTHSENDDLDLENAIDDAFKSIIPDSTKSSSEPEKKQDTELEDAIGDAFSNIFHQDTPKVSSIHESATSATEKKNTNEDDMDLDSAIGDAFKSVLPAVSKEAVTSQTHAEDVDNELRSAIGDAFKSIGAQQQTEKGEVNDDDLNDMISASFQQILGGSSLSKQAPAVTEASLADNDMKDVITEAFKSAMSTSTTKSKKSEKSKPSKSKSHNLVQNIVNQIDSKNTRMSESAIHNLAVQISHQVQDHLKDEKKNSAPNIPLVFGLPQLDESVLEHFQNEAYADKDKEKQVDQSGLQTAINNALKNVMEGSASKEDTGAADLESLQMNDILQNAFKMALEKPQELISDLEIDDTGVLVPPPQAQVPPLQKTSLQRPKTKPKKKDSDKPVSKPIIVPDIPIRSSIINDVPKLPGEVAGSTTEESSKHAETSPKKTMKKSKEPEEVKKLSIAESLALSRTILNQPRRDYSSIESIEQLLRSDRTGSSSGLSSSLNTPLSNVLSSLTSRINRGEMSDRNIMSVIRQMTETISAGGSVNIAQFLRPPTAEEIIAKYRDQEKKGVVGALEVAKKYLVAQNDGDTEKDEAVSLIDKAITKFNVEDSSRTAESSQEELPGNQTEFISSISNSVISTIISASPKSRFSTATISKIEELKANSPEFVKKVRIDNRERKKKWREENAERNKDNDLRVRVIKKANALFGDQDSPEKAAYIEETFNLRREKRIARSKKDENVSGEDDEERRFNIKTKDAFVVSRDPDLVRPVTDLYNIFKGFTTNDDSLAMLIATGASVASAASLYSQNNDTTFKSVDSAISSILTLLLATKGSNNESRASSLGFPSAVDRGIVGSLSELNLQEKREPSSLIMGDLKRTRPNEDLGINYKSSVPGPAPFWGSTSSLKMPHYKKKSDTSPSPASDQQRVLKLPRDSPFISNKVHLGVRNDNSSSSSPGLRKPGSFQKPAIVKSEGDKARGTSLGFPRLYSASYS